MLSDNFNIKEALKSYETDDKKEKKKPPSVSVSGLLVTKIPSCSTEFEQTELMKSRLVPDHPSSVVLVGGTSSGKTTALIWMFLNPQIYKQYFDEIYLFSKTGKSDNMFEHLRLKDDRIITENEIEKLNELMLKFQQEAEKMGPQNMKKRAIIFEDVTSSKKLMRSKSFLKCFVQNRHMSLSVFCCAHKYKAVTRTCRLNCSNLLIFPAPMSDVLQVIEDHSAPSLSKKQMLDMVSYCFTPDEAHQRPFFHVANKCGFKTRYRKCFDIIMELTGGSEYEFSRTT